MSREGSAGEVLATFLRLGLTSFGGPIAHPTILANQALLLRHNHYVVPAGLHARMIYDFAAPIPIVTGLRRHL